MIDSVASSSLLLRSASQARAVARGLGDWYNHYYYRDHRRPTGFAGWDRDDRPSPVRGLYCLTDHHEYMPAVMHLLGSYMPACTWTPVMFRPPYRRKKSRWVGGNGMIRIRAKGSCFPTPRHESGPAGGAGTFRMGNVNTRNENRCSQKLSDGRAHALVLLLLPLQRCQKRTQGAQQQQRQHRVSREKAEAEHQAGPNGGGYFRIGTIVTYTPPGAGASPRECRAVWMR